MPPGVLDQQALAHRPDEDKQPHDREQKGPSKLSMALSMGGSPFRLRGPGCLLMYCKARNNACAMRPCAGF